MFSGFENKTDEQLFDVLKKGDPKEKNEAWETLYQRLYPMLYNTASKMIQIDRDIQADDIVSQTLLNLYEKVQNNEKIQINNVQGYIRRMAYNLCIDTLRHWERDFLLENHQLLPGYNYDKELEKTEAMLTEVIAQESAPGLKNVLYELPFAAGLTDCPRIIWTLRLIYGYSTKVVARLMGNTENVISSHLSGANRKIKNYLKTKNYPTLHSFLQNPPTHLYEGALYNSGKIVERFAKKITPFLRDDEYQKLWPNFSDFDNYVFSYILPGLNSDIKLIIEVRDQTIGELELLAMEQSDWINFRTKMKKLLLHRQQKKDNHWWKKVIPTAVLQYIDPEDRIQSENFWLNMLLYELPTEKCFKVTVDDDYINLQPIQPYSDRSRKVQEASHYWTYGSVGILGGYRAPPIENFHQLGIIFDRDIGFAYGSANKLSFTETFPFISHLSAAGYNPRRNYKDSYLSTWTSKDK
jgi:RNA polymerase sigma factor (sigma-70 family)